MERTKEGEPLILTYSQNCQIKKEKLDLIVILTKQKTSLEIAELSQKFEKEVLS